MVNVSVNTKTCHNISLLPLRNSNNKSVIKPKKKTEKKNSFSSFIVSNLAERTGTPPEIWLFLLWI